LELKGVLAYISWSHVNLDHIKGRYVPKLVVIESRSRKEIEVEMKPGQQLELMVIPQRYCIFRKPDGKYCLSPIGRLHVESIPFCERCYNLIPSIKCIVGEPQCKEEEAPKSIKCIKSGIYQDRCKVPRFHYFLAYPIGHNSVYIKVGIQRETTYPTRVLEQGAPIIALYAKTPNIWKGREVEVESRLVLEEMVGKSISGLRIEHASEKKRTIAMVEKLVRRRSSIASTLESFMEVKHEDIYDLVVRLAREVGHVLAERFRGYKLPEVKVIRAIDLYDMDEALLRYDRIEEITSIRGTSKFKGTVVGWLGSCLLLKEKGILRIIDLRRLRGCLINISIS